MARIRKTKPVQACHLNPSYLLSWRGKKVCKQAVAALMVVCVVVTKIFFMGCFSSGIQCATVGTFRMYRIACLVLSIICLLLLMVIIILGVKCEYLQPWIWIYVKKQTKAGWIMFVTPNKDMKALTFFNSCAEIYVRITFLYYIFVYNNTRYGNTKHVRLFFCCLQALFFPLITPPTLLCFPVQHGSTECSVNEKFVSDKQALSTCSYSQCQDYVSKSVPPCECDASWKKKKIDRRR